MQQLFYWSGYMLIDEPIRKDADDIKGIAYIMVTYPF